MERVPLYSKIEKEVRQWRTEGYRCPMYPLIEVVLAHQTEEQEGGGLRYLRSAQLLALETYWYLRLIKKTPRFINLYKAFYSDNKDMFTALGVPCNESLLRLVPSIDAILTDFFDKEVGERIKGYDALRESYDLQYPSYVFALAMGAGKTVLIGTIIATEFVMSMEYPTAGFMQNALVFAPGTTIIESLRELDTMNYQLLLPSRQHQQFLANIKIHYTARANRSISVIADSKYNLIVTNTEKIIVRKRRRRNDLVDERDRLEENQRFAALAKLPQLGIFSDEAHHTYGNKTGEELKRVRETINRLHKRSPLVCVVNTTGTPYYKKQILKDVVVWYGLFEGIRDNVLKSLQDGVRQYNINKGNQVEIIRNIVKDFFTKYGEMTLFNGQKTKIAFYFNRQTDLEQAKSVIERTLVDLNYPVTSILVNTQQSTGKEIDEFNRLNDPDSQKRVILLIDKGREGWNCPSLFACALITQQTSASNFVLQAAARCLRQISGSTHAARIYLDCNNVRILDKELVENFGKHMSVAVLSSYEQEREELRVEILKIKELPRLELNRIITHLKRKHDTQKPLRFMPPDLIAKIPYFEKTTVDVHWESQARILIEKDITRMQIHELISVHSATIKIASPLHLDYMETLEALKQIYTQGLVPKHHVPELCKQAENTLGEYEEHEEVIKRVMVLIHTHNAQGEPLFEEENGKLFHTFRFSKTRFAEMRDKGLFTHLQEQTEDGQKIGISDQYSLSFHYTPYNFSSESERDFFTNIMERLKADPEDVEGVYFTGGIIDSQKTDMWIEYQGVDKLFHRYFPDFVLFKKNGECYIVEIKGDKDRGNREVELKAKAVQRLVQVQPDKIQYHILYYPPGDMRKVTEWINQRRNP